MPNTPKLSSDAALLLAALDQAVVLLGEDKKVSSRAQAGIDAHGFSAALFVCDLYYSDCTIRSSAGAGDNVRVTIDAGLGCRAAGVAATVNFSTHGDVSLAVAQTRAAAQAALLNKAMLVEGTLTLAYTVLGQARLAAALVELDALRVHAFEATKALFANAVAQ